jgi:type IV conjugative transfer system coupling protein TraD
MLGNFIGGGQIFLHNVRMFMQVLGKSFKSTVIVTLLLVTSISYVNKDYAKLDLIAVVTYGKAVLANDLHNILYPVRSKINPKHSKRYAMITASTKYGVYAREIEAVKIVKDSRFNKEYLKLKDYAYTKLVLYSQLFSGVLLIVFALWSRFGRRIKTEEHISGATIKTAEEVKHYLRSQSIASSIVIGNMPLVKNSETRHMLVTGSTGSGKTNLLHNILPQIVKLSQPAIIIDQTGEMIARYYNEARGDIIFNPLDARSTPWDFWQDMQLNANNSLEVNTALEKFTKILFTVAKGNHRGGDPFWDNSAMAIFCAIVKHLAEVAITDKDKAYRELRNLCHKSDVSKLAIKLKGTEAEPYLSKEGTTAGSIISVLATSTKPIKLLSYAEKSFSLTEYFNKVKAGNKSWLFLSSPPHLREITLPLLAGIFELSLAELIRIGVDDKRRIWFIFDELASLGRLNSLSTLMSEGRKYGGAVIAATQNFNQLLENFGTYQANHLFSQFATKFMFRSDDAISAKLIAEIAGEREYQHKQKNTSFGSSEMRDGISYSEQQRSKKVVTADMLASLKPHECFVCLPEPSIRIAKITVPLNKTKEVNEGFVKKVMSADDNQGVIKDQNNSSEDKEQEYQNDSNGLSDADTSSMQSKQELGKDEVSKEKGFTI